MALSIKQKLEWRLIVFLARRLPGCDQMTRLFSEARERPTTLREKITMRLHLFTCEACRRYVAQIERISETVKPKTEETIVAADSPIKLSDAARRRIKAALEIAAHSKS